MPKTVRALRGATTVEADDADAIGEATRELLSQIMSVNALVAADVVSVIFTVTADLRSDFPARAARDLGWVDVPLLCTVEIPVPNALARCIRVLMHVETARSRDAMRHVYLRQARTLRPDLLAD
jgi:chorismate mutase